MHLFLVCIYSLSLSLSLCSFFPSLCFLLPLSLCCLFFSLPPCVPSSAPPSSLLSLRLSPSPWVTTHYSYFFHSLPVVGCCWTCDKRFCHKAETSHEEQHWGAADSHLGRILVAVRLPPTFLCILICFKLHSETSKWGHTPFKAQRSWSQFSQHVLKKICEWCRETF